MITDLSNYLMTYLERGAVLRYGMAQGCRCMGCHEFQIVGSDGSILTSAEALEDFLKTATASQGRATKQIFPEPEA